MAANSDKPPQRIPISLDGKARLPKIPCIMCRRIVTDIKDYACRHYGLLEHCFHSYCLQCIRQFTICKLRNTRPEERESSPGCPVIVCPLCGAPSASILASSTFPMDPEEKGVKFAAYKLSTQTIPCPYLQHGVGECLCLAENHRYMFTAMLEMEAKNGII